MTELRQTSVTVKRPFCNLPMTAENLEERSMWRFRFEAPGRAEGHVLAGASEQSLIRAVKEFYLNRFEEAFDVPQMGLMLT